MGSAKASGVTGKQGGRQQTLLPAPNRKVTPTPTAPGKQDKVTGERGFHGDAPTQTFGLRTASGQDPAKRGQLGRVPSCRPGSSLCRWHHHQTAVAATNPDSQGVLSQPPAPPEAFLCALWNSLPVTKAPETPAPGTRSRAAERQTRGVQVVGWPPHGSGERGQPDKGAQRGRQRGRAGPHRKPPKRPRQ